jgi:hypothetical protein
MNDVVQVHCPYCFELVELWIDPDTAGSFVEDCAVCCRPWQVTATRDANGAVAVSVDRAQ